MKNPLFIFLFQMATGLTFAIDPVYPVSTIPDELKKDVNAVVREDKMLYKIVTQSTATVTNYFAVTILNERAKHYAVQQVDYDKLTKVVKFTGSVYDATGKLIKKLKNNEIVDQSAYDGGLYNDNRIKSADLRQSTYPYTVVFEYEKEYKFLYIIDGSAVLSEEKISVEHFSYQLKYPPDLAPRFHTIGIDVTPKKESMIDGTLSITWELSNIMPIKFEPMSERRSVIPRIMAAPTRFEFEGYVGDMQSWDEYGRWINSLSKGRRDLPEETRRAIQQLTRHLKTKEEKTKAIYQYLQSKTRYVSIQLGIGGFQPFEASLVDRTGYGDCKALSNYMISLLEAAGVKAYYALISAGKEAPKLIKEFPSSQFNHAIAFVPNDADTLWLECTSQTNPFGYTGTHTGDRTALAITDNGATIVKTPTYLAEDNVQSRTAEVIVQLNGNANAKVRTTYSGLQYENDYLSFILENQYDEQRKWIQNNTQIPSFDINSFSMLNVKQKNPSAIVNLDLTLNRFSTVSGKRLFLTPNLMNRSTFVPEKVEGRKTNVVCTSAYVDLDTINYIIPEDIYPEFIPQPIKFKSRFGEYEAHYKLDQGKFVYIRRIKMIKGKFPPESYTELIDFYKNVSKADNTKLVFLSKT